MKTALSIAGSDSSGGAGIQADMKTMTMNGVYAMTAITALTAQNTTGVQGIYEVPADFLAAQIDSVFADIVPDAVKIGMIASPELVETIASKLTEYEAKNIVVDPVMVSTSGSALSKGSAVSRMKEVLFPLAAVITPNIPEAEALSGMAIRSADEMEKAAEIDNPNTHGTGCTLSSAIAANLAKGYTLTDAIDRAKAYISGALGAMLDLGQGSGPPDHIFDLTGEYAKEAK